MNILILILIAQLLCSILLFVFPKKVSLYSKRIKELEGAVERAEKKISEAENE